MRSTRVKRHSRVNIRRSHPGFYHGLMVFAVFEVLMAANLWWYTPTFIPYDISLDLIGLVFLALGITQLVFLNVWRDLRKIRLAVAVSVGFTFFWGVANTQQIFAGNASWALPLSLLALCAGQLVWLVEAPVNPMTERKP